MIFIKAIEDLKKCLEAVEKTKDEQKRAAITNLKTVNTKVTTATKKLVKEHIAYNKYEAGTITQQTAIVQTEYASVMVQNYWSILKTCEEAVKKRALE